MVMFADGSIEMSTSSIPDCDVLEIISLDTVSAGYVGPSSAVEIMYDAIYYTKYYFNSSNPSSACYNSSSYGVSPLERQALEALYNSTNG